MKDIMLDLETMSQEDSNAAIGAIGAVSFDRQRQVVGDRFYVVVDLQSSLDSGGVVDGDTITWWLKQSESARMALCEDSKPLSEALTLFDDWFRTQGDPECICVWGNGVDYDNVILRNSYRRLGRSAPWNFRNQKCYRSLKTDFPEVRYIPTGTLHNAADDAYSQVWHLLRIDDESGAGLILAALERQFPELLDGEAPISGSDAVQQLSDWRLALKRDVGKNLDLETRKE